MLDTAVNLRWWHWSTCDHELSIVAREIRRSYRLLVSVKHGMTVNLRNVDFNKKNHAIPHIETLT